MEENRLWSGGPIYLPAEHMPLTTDALVLADFAGIRPGEKGVDLGCASGLLMLLLLWRERTLTMTGLELLPEAAKRAESNLALNGLSDRAEIVCGDLREEVGKLPNGSFDFVISNPPYQAEHRGAVSPDREKASARGESSLTLTELCHAAGRLCRSGGKVWFCYRPERMAELFREMRRARLEPKRLRMVHHSVNHPASLLLIEGRKDGGEGLTAEKPLLIRDENGKESGEYRRICHRN